MNNFKRILFCSTALFAAQAAFAAELKFDSVDVPLDDAGKREVRATGSVSIDGEKHAIGYRVLARTGDKIGGKDFGLMIDRKGNPVRNSDGTNFISDDPDFTSIIPVGSKIFSITHFETRPGGMYLSELSQDDKGNLTPVSTRPIDLSGIDGLWVPCAGSVTPWGSHLGSEEYPTDARAFVEAHSISDIDSYVYPMVRYEGVDHTNMSLDTFRAAYKPYKYGFPVEVKISEDGETAAHKHYAMGRVAVELAYVMPDQKTAYITDDGTNTGLFRFVADNEGDLSSGTLYAAKWVQTSDEGAGAADLEWIDLGHAESATVRMALNLGVDFHDLFDVASYDKDGNCPEGFLSSNAEGRAECLRVKPGMEVLASRLETRRYASMLGATAEFRKMEGITYDADGKNLYLSMSEIAKGMEDGSKQDKGGRNDVRLGVNKCGAVYEMTVDGDYVARSARTLVAGTPSSYAEGSPEAGNSCDLEGIANPDNLTYIPGSRTLIIGEDTGSGHQNDAIWAFNLDSKELTRIFTTPYGSETTSPYWHANVNGFSYLTAVIQHPYGESDEDKLENPADARAYVGYIGPFPADAVKTQ